MKRNEDFRNALGQPDEYFRQSVIDTLDQLNMQAEKEKRPQRRYPARLVCTFAALALAITGLSLSGVHIPGIPTESSVDAIRPTPTVATQLESQPSIEAEYASLIFRKAEKTDSGIRFTIEVRPRHDHSVVLSTAHLLSDSCSGVSEFYGITPDSPGQSLYRWVTDRGCREALAADIASAYPEEGYSGPFPNSYHTESCTVREDGSSVLTVTGPAAGDNVYNLDWAIVPWNMQDQGNSFLPDLAEHGNLRLEVAGEQDLRITAVPRSPEKYLSRLTFRSFVPEENNSAIQVEAVPLHQNSLVLPPSVYAFEDSPEKIGKIPDYEGQTILQWAHEHGCPDIIKITFVERCVSPFADSGSTDGPVIVYGGEENTNFHEDGSVDFLVYSSDVSGTDIPPLLVTFRIWDTETAYLRKDEGYEGKTMFLNTQFLHQYP